MSYEELKRSLGLPETQLDRGFCAEWFHTVTSFQDRGGVDYTVKMKHTAESLGLKSEDYSHLNPRSSKNHAQRGKDGGRKGGGRNRKKFWMSRRKRKSA